MRLSFLSKSRGIRNLFWRILLVLSRFNFSPRKFEKYLEEYYKTTHAQGCIPTFAITAVVMARHPKVIQELSGRGVEFAIHGYKHIDYKVLDRKGKISHFSKAIDIFNKCGIPFVGFRAPFLRFSDQTTPILSEMGFKYHSSRVLYWKALDIDKLSKYAKHSHDCLLEFCTPQDPNDYFSLPRFVNSIVEIPVSIPDDETFERLQINDQKQIADIWFNMFQQIHSRGELFILSLHPERITQCSNALTDILQRVRALEPSVWVVTMKEIAEWWQEKNDFSFKISYSCRGGYEVHADCTDRATILIRNANVNVASEEWINGYRVVKAKDFVVESERLPIIGINPDTSPDVMKFLKNEGYFFEVNEKSDNYWFYLDGISDFEERDGKPLFSRIENSNVPLLKYWRWPDKHGSALSVTGDIDSMTVTDFVLRIIDNIQCLPLRVRKTKQLLKHKYQIKS